MDAELVDLASSRPEILMRFLDSQGVESFSDLRGIWGSSLEFVSEIESFAGQALPADEAMGLATFWALASKRAHDGHRRLVDALVSERSSSYRSSVRLQEAPQEPPTSSSRVRRLIADGTSGPSPMVVLTATTDAHAKEQAQKQTKLDVMFELALNYVVKLEDLGRASPATMDLISEIQPLCNWQPFSRVWHKGAQPQRHLSSRLCYGGAGPLAHSSPWTIGWWLLGDFMLVIIKADKLSNFHHGSF